ncbi:MAG: hypothetical protein QI197_08505 [Candidatus Korarchaeota archaeon]|nr:hypothetical protein [Candidatus Korarchaeota archaeon]
MGELDEIKELLFKIIERLDRLEIRMESAEADLRSLEVYKSLLRAYASILGSVAKVERMAQLVTGDIDRSIIRALATKGPLNISQLTEEVRKLRGSASRRIISERLRILEEKGFVERVDGRGKVYRVKLGVEIND